MEDVYDNLDQLFKSTTEFQLETRKNGSNTIAILHELVNLSKITNKMSEIHSVEWDITQESK